ncbi:MAG: sodium:solute symporter family protein [Lentisphaeria bacterium]|nr:sodium:solute symporter family protein [Lentisphaeria bacterium]
MGVCLAAAGNFDLSAGMMRMLLIGIVIYMIVMLLIGWFSSRKVNEMSDFLVAGRRLPLWMATATLLATWFGAGSSMGVSATVYADGIGGVLADPFGAALSLIFAGVFIVGMLRKKGCMTVTDIIERRYGKGAGIYASLWMVPVYVGWLGAQLLGLGTILNLLTGISVQTGTLIGAAVVLLYTCAGGMWAVTLTDVVQVGIMIVGLIVLLPGTIELAGGSQAVLQSLRPEDTLLPVGAGNFNDYVYYIGSWIVMGLGCMVGQDLVQRSLSSKNANVAVASSVISGFVYVIIGFIPVSIGIAARILLPKYGITEDVMGGDLENQVLPRIAMLVLGNSYPLLLTIFIAALTAAIMSSADSSLLAGASLLCNNVIAPMFPKLRANALLIGTRVTTVLLTLVALVLAIWVKSIYSLMINSWISQLVIVFIPVVAALYVPKAGRNTAWATMIVGTVIWLGYTFIASCGTGLPLTELLSCDDFDRAITCGAVYGFISALLTFVCCYIGERIAGEDDKTASGEADA